MKETPKEILQHYFNLNEFRPSQEEIIDSILQGKNTMAVMPTGSGKSLCYQIPALLLPGTTIVVTPLIALMKDQVDNLKKRHIAAEFINSSLSKFEREKRLKSLARGEYKLIYISPERFYNEQFIEAVSKIDISFFVVDEAHCISQWGGDFRPAYSQVGDFRSSLGKPLTAAFTATATPEVQSDITHTLFHEKSPELFNLGINRPNLHMGAIDVIDETEKFTIIEEYLEKEKGSAIIYFNLIKNLTTFSYYCQEKKIPHGIYHGQLSPQKRTEVQESFLQGKKRLILATNAFGMGIDKPDIRLIIHAEVPGSVESYYQEIGRAGRDGKDSKALLLFSQDDLAVQMSFIDWANPGVSYTKECFTVMKKLGSSLASYTYEDLQELTVYKNRGDHRLKTVLSLFDRFGVTTGSIDTHTLGISGTLDDTLTDEHFWERKKQNDLKKLYDMVQYVRTEECRRTYLHKYFSLQPVGCGNCDKCIQ
jgi:ATP-dependent DNA helicase RecQ